MLYSRSLLITYFINSSVSVKPTLLIYPSSLLFSLSNLKFVFFSISVSVFLCYK